MQTSMKKTPSLVGGALVKKKKEEEQAKKKESKLLQMKKKISFKKIPSDENNKTINTSRRLLEEGKPASGSRLSEVRISEPKPDSQSTRRNSIRMNRRKSVPDATPDDWAAIVIKEFPVKKELYPMKLDAHNLRQLG